MSDAKLIVQEIFQLSNGFVIAAGIVKGGMFRVEDNVVVVQQNGREHPSSIGAMEVQGSQTRFAYANEKAALFLHDITRQDIEVGDTVISSL